MKKRKQTKRKRAKKTAGRKSKRPAVFSRAPSAAQTSINPNAWKDWARGREAVNVYESRQRQVYKILIAHDVDDYTANLIAYGLDPEKFYIVEIYGYASSDPHDAGAPGDTVVKQAVFVGAGIRLWSRIISYARRAPIDHIDVNEIDAVQLDRPLWDQFSVTTVDGVRIRGHGQLNDFQDRRKKGRRKKTGGGMTAPQRRQNRKSKTAALQRRIEIDNRIAELKKTNPAAADRLLERSKRARKIQL